MGDTQTFFDSLGRPFALHSQGLSLPWSKYSEQTGMGRKNLEHPEWWFTSQNHQLTSEAHWIIWPLILHSASSIAWAHVRQNKGCWLAHGHSGATLYTKGWSDQTLTMFIDATEAHPLIMFKSNQNIKMHMYYSSFCICQYFLVPKNLKQLSTRFMWT